MIDGPPRTETDHSTINHGWSIVRPRILHFPQHCHCAGNSPVTGEFPAQMPVTWNFNVFFDVHLNKRLSKQWRGWWFETPSRPLWRQCNELHLFLTNRHVVNAVRYQARQPGKRSKPHELCSLYTTLMFSFSTGLTDLHIIHVYAIGKAGINILRNQLYHLEMVQKIRKRQRRVHI